VKQDPNNTLARPSPAFNEKAGTFDRVASGLGMGMAFALVLGSLMPGDSNIQHIALMTGYGLFGFAFGAGRESFRIDTQEKKAEPSFDKPGVIESLRNRLWPS
jgi:hypothetical protein